MMAHSTFEVSGKYVNLVIRTMDAEEHNHMTPADTHESDANVELNDSRNFSMYDVSAGSYTHTSSVISPATASLPCSESNSEYSGSCSAGPSHSYCEMHQIDPTAYYTVNAPAQTKLDYVATHQYPEYQLITDQPKHTEMPLPSSNIQSIINVKIEQERRRAKAQATRARRKRHKSDTNKEAGKTVPISWRKRLKDETERRILSPDQIKKEQLKRERNKAAAARARKRKADEIADLKREILEHKAVIREADARFMSERARRKQLEKQLERCRCESVKE